MKFQGTQEFLDLYFESFLQSSHFIIIKFTFARDREGEQLKSKLIMETVSIINCAV